MEETGFLKSNHTFQFPHTISCILHVFSLKTKLAGKRFRIVAHEESSLSRVLPESTQLSVNSCDNRGGGGGGGVDVLRHRSCKMYRR